MTATLKFRRPKLVDVVASGLTADFPAELAEAVQISTREAWEGDGDVIGGTRVVTERFIEKQELTVDITEFFFPDTGIPTQLSGRKDGLRFCAYLTDVDLQATPKQATYEIEGG